MASPTFQAQLSLKKIWTLISRLWRLEFHDLQITIILQHRSVLIFFIISFLWYLANPTREAAMATFFLGGTILLAYLWARRMAWSIRADRKLRYVALQVGDELEEIVTLTNHSILPVVWVETVDQSNLPGYTVTSGRTIDSHETMEWRAHTICSRRGVFSLGPWEVWIGEPLGIFQVRQRYLKSTEVLVVPPLASLPPALIPRRQSLGDYRPLRQPSLTASVNSYTTRNYVPGDPLHHIHWRTTARLNKPFVKVFEPESASTIWLIPDLDASVQVGEGESSTLEKMIILTATLAAELLRSQLAVGLLTQSGKTILVPPEHGTAHLWRILNALAPLQADSKANLGSILIHARSMISPQDLAVIITPSLQTGWTENLRNLAHDPRRSPGEILLLDPQSFGGQQSAEPLITWFTETGVSARLIRNEDIRPISATYGEISQWEFKTLGTGRVIVRKTPRKAGLGLALHSRFGSSHD